MIDKVVVCRKDHMCCYCSKIIKKGESANYLSGKTPKFDENDKQIGIEYFNVYYCLGYACVEYD